MSKINLFIAKTPLQLFNCIEAKNRFHKEDKSVLLYQYQRSIDQIQMKNLIKKDEWFDVIAYPLAPLHRLLFPIFLNKNIIQYQNKVTSCYFGAYNSIISYFINKVKPKNFIIIDDGVKTIKISEFIKDRKLDKKGFLRPLRDKVMKASREYVYDAKFFTIYDEVKEFVPNRVIKNDYRAFKEHISSMEKEDIIYFIGTNLLERSIKTKEIFEKELKHVLEYYIKNNKRIIYVLHRYEDVEYINDLSKKYGFESVKFDNIIEVELLKRGTIPMGVASFASTAVETIDMIYGVDATIFELENSGICEKYQEVFRKLYDNFRGKRVEVIKL